MALGLASIPAFGYLLSHITVFVSAEGAQAVIVPRTTLCEDATPQGCKLIVTMYLLQKPHLWLEFMAYSLVASASLMFVSKGYNPLKWNLNPQMKKDLKYLAVMFCIAAGLLFLAAYVETSF
jgi:hypothetical protein